MSEDNKSAPEPGQEPAKQASRDKFDFNTTIQALWNGEVPLVETFWLYYFLAVFAFSVLGGMLAFLAPLFGLLKIVWAGFMIKPIWLAADKYKGPEYWVWAAKIAAVLIGIGVVLDLLS